MPYHFLFQQARAVPPSAWYHPPWQQTPCCNEFRLVIGCSWLTSNRTCMLAEPVRITFALTRTKFPTCIRLRNWIPPNVCSHLIAPAPTSSTGIASVVYPLYYTCAMYIAGKISRRRLSNKCQYCFSFSGSYSRFIKLLLMISRAIYSKPLMLNH
jgi:hypothetical protein